ncbi:hypothetical protein [Pedosphaera parvula]|uniref:Uncharacterized protein n=1 Tax=Pedosphaera parvula (strain Ellin514) TaxID=320771 RepID=B9XF32_PEDPL|nr:hypothetical protein [Pedosphaera parvula]EEF61530.1 hypothetical protein Cflav_PD4208 [Pedosphaera parvula Ellin514]
MMRCFVTGLLFSCCLLLAPAIQAASGSIIKVLPQFLDEHGKASLSPSLYDRDAYQADLRRHPLRRSGVRYNIQWKARVPKSDQLKLRVELRGVAQGKLPKELTLEKIIPERYWLSHWSNLDLSGETYRSFGEVTAWHVTIWDGDKMLDEQKSFLWGDKSAPPQVAH